jgi:uncharacterized protein YbjT (DUF2867 family)
MQNFTGMLHEDLVKRNRIFLRAGNAKFTLIDVRDLGDVAARILTEPEKHTNKAYELTNQEKFSFRQMAGKLSEGLGRKIQYISPSLIHFYLTKRKENIPFMLILVMMMLHFLPRFQKEPGTSNRLKKITGLEPKTFQQFIEDNKPLLST